MGFEAIGSRRFRVSIAELWDKSKQSDSIREVMETTDRYLSGLGTHICDKCGKHECVCQALVGERDG